MGTVLTQFTVDGVALWVVLLICGGVFLGSFMTPSPGAAVHHRSHLSDGAFGLPYLQCAGDQ